MELCISCRHVQFCPHRDLHLVNSVLEDRCCEKRLVERHAVCLVLRCHGHLHIVGLASFIGYLQLNESGLICLKDIVLVVINELDVHAQIRRHEHLGHILKIEGNTFRCHRLSSSLSQQEQSDNSYRQEIQKQFLHIDFYHLYSI